jgi:hypothetical protein
MGKVQGFSQDLVDTMEALDSDMLCSGLFTEIALKAGSGLSAELSRFS